MRCRALMLMVLIATACGAQGRYGVGLDGRPVARLAGPEARTVVLFFVATDCPVSNREFPEMLRLRAKFAGQGVRFWFVYPNATEKRGCNSWAPAGIQCG